MKCILEKNKFLYLSKKRKELWKEIKDLDCELLNLLDLIDAGELPKDESYNTILRCGHRGQRIRKSSLEQNMVPAKMAVQDFTLLCHCMQEFLATSVSVGHTGD